MQAKQPISIVIPTLNEVDNIPAMMARIDAVLVPAAIPYEVVIVDDHSTDGTVEIAKNLALKYPLSLYNKQGERGKAYSLLEGFEKARHELIVMIDADLQYPPEEILPMYNIMQSTNADVIVTNRQTKDVSALRKFVTKGFNFVFARVLFGISFDTQSGLKLFRKEILSHFTMRPSPWSFDLEFLVRSLENKFTIVSHDIIFAERSHGATKVKLINVSFELAKASLQLWWRTSQPRIRAGYQANNQFLKKALRVLIATSVLAVASLTVQPASTQAVNMPLTNNSVANIITETFNSITGNNNSNTTPSAPTSTPASTPTSVQPASQTAATQTNQPTNAQPTPAAATTPAGNATSGNGATISNPAAANVPAAIVPSQSALSAATAAKASSAYANTYPNYVPDEQTNDRLFAISQTAIVAGLSCLVAAIIISGIRLTRTMGTVLVTRN